MIFARFPESLRFNLSAAEVTVPARGKALVPTDLSIAIPEGTYARVGKLAAGLDDEMLFLDYCLFSFLFVPQVFDEMLIRFLQRRGLVWR
jgi:hypothetical protein